LQIFFIFRALFPLMCSAWLPHPCAAIARETRRIIYVFTNVLLNVRLQLYLEFAALSVREGELEGLLATLREVQATEQLEFAADPAPAAAAAAAPVDVEIDWGDLLEVDAAADAAAAPPSTSSACDPAPAIDFDIDWTVVSAEGGGGGGGGEISWDFDVVAEEEGAVGYVAVGGGDDEYGISISTDGVGGKVNVFEDPERWGCCSVVLACLVCMSRVTRHTSHVTRHTSHVTRQPHLILHRRTLLLADILGASTATF
jgi:hypothetical protein